VRTTAQLLAAAEEAEAMLSLGNMRASDSKATAASLAASSQQLLEALSALDVKSGGDRSSAAAVDAASLASVGRARGGHWNAAATSSSKPGHHMKHQNAPSAASPTAALHAKPDAVGANSSSSSKVPASSAAQLHAAKEHHNAAVHKHRAARTLANQTRSGRRWPGDTMDADDLAIQRDLDGGGPVHQKTVPAPPGSIAYKDPSSTSGNNGSAVDQAGKVLVALGGGTGASIGGTGNRALDKDMATRMRCQDSAVMLLMVIVYMVTLFLLASLTYRRSHNNSQVTYYADPRFYQMVMEGHESPAFLDAFNQAPKSVQLQVTGFIPVPEGVLGSIQWQGDFFHVAFTFALDLSPWVVRETQDATLTDGVLTEDLDGLAHFLECNCNDLSCVELQKDVAWPGWEELATNIKQQIRQRGFTGLIGIHRTETENFLVHKNKTWANFMHNRTTKVICALSLFGWLLYLPYMWIRCTRTVVRSRFKVEIDINSYWPLISSHLTSDGFVSATS